jgi:hypothetical protein
MTGGTLEENRLLTQIVSYALLGQLNVHSDEFSNSLIATNPNHREVYYQAIEVMENFASFYGVGNIVDVVYLICREISDFVQAQPQLVPVYTGEAVFVNALKDIDGDGTAQINKFAFCPILTAAASTREDVQKSFRPAREGEFIFGLYRQDEQGEWEFMLDIPTDINGIVQTPELPVGSYRFIERPEIVNCSDGRGGTVGGQEWKFVWGPRGFGFGNGIYFEMRLIDGEVVPYWGPLPGIETTDGNGNLNVFNIWQCKYNVLADVSDPTSEPQFRLGSHGRHCYFAIYEYTNNCIEYENMHFRCPVSHSSFDITLGPPLEHLWVPAHTSNYYGLVNFWCERPHRCDARIYKMDFVAWNDMRAPNGCGHGNHDWEFIETRGSWHYHRCRNCGVPPTTFGHIITPEPAPPVVEEPPAVTGPEGNGTQPGDISGGNDTPGYIPGGYNQPGDTPGAYNNGTQPGYAPEATVPGVGEPLPGGEPPTVAEEPPASPPEPSAAPIPEAA